MGAPAIMRAALFLATVATACSPTPLELSAPIARGGSAAVPAREEADQLWADRLDEHKLRAAIAAWKRAVAVADDDADSWLMLARASYFLGDGFLDLAHAPDAEVTRTFAEGAAFADRGLRARLRSYEARRRAGLEVDEAAAGLGAEAVPFIYWWGLNTIRWADRVGWSAGLRVYKHVLRVMEEVRAVEPAYAHGGADRFLGAFYTEAPGVAGGDVERGRAHLERAIALAPGYLENREVVAERFARKVRSARIFDDNVRLVRETPSSVVPDAIPEQEIAKRKAARLTRKY
jgi:TRAP transporter TatT component family protein